MPERIRLCPAQEIGEGRARGFDLDGEGTDTIFVVRVGGRLTAWRNACPHQGAAMALRRDVYLNAAGDRIVCYAHGAEFCPESGVCLQGPCVGRKLRPAAVEIDNEGALNALVA
ncbi:MAG: Rieske (2Fe-2S) protein [Pseudomonadota bacterium]|nr:Rieske (2Fe-2S) protein [Pseudomonadota bacterium]